MKLKGRQTMSREEVGRLLKELGENISSGKLTYPPEFGKTSDISMPKELHVEIEYNEKWDKKKFEIELEWFIES